MISTETVTLTTFPEPLTLVHDTERGTLTILTDQQSIGSLFIGTVNPVPAREIVETEPIIEDSGTDG
jgi:hypothetical protein